MALPAWLRPFMTVRSDGRAEPLDALHSAASIMAKHGASVRHERARAKVIDTANELRVQMGMPPFVRMTTTHKETV